jgi:NAD(P)-dependent dehydrogenase (short-subunit alcohol dehydrogenase family)
MGKILTQRFEGKVAVVVGGATGIGAATARRLADEAARVVVADVAGDRAQAMSDSIVEAGGLARPFTCDITESDQIAALFSFAEETFGGVDAVHVNAADLSLTNRDTDAVTVPLEVFDRTITVNLRGHLLAARFAIPAMLKRNGGSIVFTGSRGGLTSDSVRVSYAISKAGLLALSRHIALKWGKQGIRSNVVAPGTVLTDPVLQQGAAFIQDRLGSASSPALGTSDGIAAGVAYLLSDESAFVNGQILSIDGGATMR